MSVELNEQEKQPLFKFGSVPTLLLSTSYSCFGEFRECEEKMVFKAGGLRFMRKEATEEYTKK